MKDKKKSHTFVTVIRRILLVLLIVIVLLVVSVIALYQYAKPRVPEVFKSFFNRDLSYDELKISLRDLTFSAKNIKLSNGNEELLFAKSVDTKITLKNLLKLELNIEYLYIDDLVTYVEKDNNLFSIPKYVEIKQSKDTNKEDSIKKKSGLAIPITISEIDIKNSELKLKENNKKSNFITSINIFLPGINITGKEQKLEPRIQAKIGKKEIDIRGTTAINGSRIENNLNLKLSSFDINDVSALIPQFNGLKIVGGLITTNSNIKFIIDKNKKPIFIIDGSLSFSKINIYDLKVKQSFINNLSGSVDSLHLSIFEGLLRTSNINVSSVNINLTISDDEKKNSAVIPEKSSKKKNNFNFTTSKIKIYNFNLTFNDLINKQIYKFNDTTINTNGLSFPFNNDPINFSLNTTTQGAEKIDINADIILKTMDIDIKALKLSNIAPLYFNVIKKNVPDLKSCYINNLYLTGAISKDKKELSVIADIKDLEYVVKGYSRPLELKKLDIDIPKFSLADMKVIIKKLDIRGATIPVDKEGETILESLNFSLEQQNPPNEFSIVKENNKNILLLKEKVGFNRLNGVFSSANIQFDFGLKKISLEPNLKIDLSSPNFLQGKTNVYLEELNLLDKQKIPQFKIKTFSLDVDSLNIEPFKLIVESIDIKSDYATTTVKEDSGVYIFSIFRLGGDPNNQKTNNNKKNVDIIKNMNIMSTNISIDKIILSDLAIKEQFSLEISDVSLKLNNFPSTIYPEGDFALNGIMNRRNPISITGKIASITEFNGILQTKDLMLPQFSPLTKEYINYNITSGTASTETKFSMFQKSFSINISLTLNHLRLDKIPGSKGKDFSPIIQTMEDANSNIKIDIPITNNDRAKIKIDTKRIFFDLFVNFFSGQTQSNPIAILGNIIKGDVASEKFTFNSDNVYDIVYFKPGKDEFARDLEEMLSESFLKAIKNRNKVFLVEGYVDKNRDTPILKNRILEDKIILYSGTLPDKGSYEEIETLRRVYREYYNEEADDVLEASDIKLLILDKIKVSNTDYYSLSYSRINKIKDILINDYNLSENRITSNEANIFENQYISNISNNIGIITTGTK